MTKEATIRVFSELGLRIKQLPSEELTAWKRLAEIHNKWFTEDNVQTALDGIVEMLRKEQLEKWLANYSIPSSKSRVIGVVMAGNIPAVGFHDMLCVLVSGNILHAKLSSDDSILIKKIAALLIEIDSSFQERIHFVDRLNAVDAVIATGSDNTAKHFEYYFAKVPRIVRRNRTSVAVLDGTETQDELALLGKDIFQYFGLGCRNVSKLFIPKDMPLARIYEAVEPFKTIMNSVKYVNNYEYNRSIFLLKSILHLDNGFMLLLETPELMSSIAVVYYEKYTSLESLKETLNEQADKIQCIVSKNGAIENAVLFGNAQCPAVWDYADGVDTMEFLLAI